MHGVLAGRRVLVVDDELAIRKALCARFKEEGADAETASDVSSARKKIESGGAQGDFDLVVLDHRLPDGTGLALLEQLRTDGVLVEVVMMTAYSSTSDAVRAMKSGAADYVMKPFDLDEMMLVAGRALETRELRGEVRRLRARDRKGSGVEELIGSSQMMTDLRSLVKRVSDSGARTILVRGESGTGKDMVARAIHYASPEVDRPFLNITCTALPEALLESELFGHEKGAFTDGKQAKAGLFEQAHGGTIFLDEIGDMSVGLQAKLLRFLESKQFRRVGGLRDISVNVRIIAATNCDLEGAIRDGRFRSDLYYRLNVIPIDVLPLRDHTDDVEPLVRHFVSQFSAELKKPLRGVTDEAMERLAAHDWPGNIRELRNCIERAIILGAEDQLGVEDLPIHLRGEGNSRAGSPIAGERVWELPEEGVVVDDLLSDLLDQALVRCDGNKSHAARLLGIHRDQVRYWVKKYALTRWIRTKVRGSEQPTGEED